MILACITTAPQGRDGLGKLVNPDPAIHYQFRDGKLIPITAGEFAHHRPRCHTYDGPDEHPDLREIERRINYLLTGSPDGQASGATLVSERGHRVFWVTYPAGITLIAELITGLLPYFASFLSDGGLLEFILEPTPGRFDHPPS